MQLVLNQEQGPREQFSHGPSVDYEYCKTQETLVEDWQARRVRSREADLDHV